MLFSRKIHHVNLKLYSEIITFDEIFARNINLYVFNRNEFTKINLRLEYLYMSKIPAVEKLCRPFIPFRHWTIIIRYFFHISFKYHSYRSYSSKTVASSLNFGLHIIKQEYLKTIHLYVRKRNKFCRTVQQIAWIIHYSVRKVFNSNTWVIV